MAECLICQRRPPDEDSQVCPACRARTRTVLAEIPGLVADLRAELVDGVLSPSTGGRVSGTPEAPVPLRLDLVDLLADARPGSVLPHANAALHQMASVVHRTKTLERHTYAAHWDDQIGGLSAATVLDAWVTDWIGHRGKGEHRPEPTVPVLCRWLADRWDDACDDHPAVDEVALDLRDLHGRLRAAAGLLGPYPELCDGVPCRRCDALDLWRMPGSEYIECRSCPDLMTPDEYDRWCGLVAASVKGRIRA